MRLRIALLLVLVASACSTVMPPPRRGTEPPAPAMTLDDLEQRRLVTGADNAKDCSDLVLRKQSIEDFKDSRGKHFFLGVVELSDDGHVADYTQERQVLRKLREVALGGSGKGVDRTKSPGAVVVTFVHGWHHGSKVCDNNLACFRRVLQALSLADPRPVFGVYVGWRGELFHGSVPSALSFYNRKSTAQKIGREGGREVLLRLDEAYRDLNGEIENGMRHPVTMVTAGHSFGGALVYSAVEAALVRELPKNVPGTGSEHVVGDRPVKCGTQLVRPIRPGIGDLVVLVNPAFEASRYREFAADETKTEGRYADKQLPVLLTVASEGDSAVKLAFPAGRILYFSLMPWLYRGTSDVIGAGHYDPQTTHDIVVEDDAGTVTHPPAAMRAKPQPVDEATQKRCNLQLTKGDFATCECEYKVPDELELQAGQGSISLDKGKVRTAPNENVALRLRPNHQGRDPHSPFIVARVAPEVISAHSDIYTPRFITFLTAYISEFVRQAAAVPAATDYELDSPCGALETASTAK